MYKRCLAYNPLVFGLQSLKLVIRYHVNMVGRTQGLRYEGTCQRALLEELPLVTVKPCESHGYSNDKVVVP